jgi:hypothetical protein
MVRKSFAKRFKNHAAAPAPIVKLPPKIKVNVSDKDIGT